MGNDIIYTIGYTQKNAKKFFSLLATSHASKIIDIRLNNSSQLAGFTKQEDLSFFLRKILDWDYVYQPLLAPTKELLDNYKKKIISWNDYELIFHQILEERKVYEKITRGNLVNGVLLCSENLPNYCHRRLVAEYFKKKWENIEIKHLF